jgi:dolichol kinase
VTLPARREGGRRLVHLATGLVGVAALQLAEPAATLLVALVFAAALVLEIARLVSPLRERLDRLSGGLYRPAEAARVSGATLLTGSYLLVWLLFPATVAARAIVVAAVADPAAAAVGSRWSGRPGRKSMTGSLAALAAALLVLLAWQTALVPAVVAAVAAAGAERVPCAGLDNVTVPLVTAFALDAVPYATAVALAAAA